MTVIGNSSRGRRFNIMIECWLRINHLKYISCKINMSFRVGDFLPRWRIGHIYPIVL